MVVCAKPRGRPKVMLRVLVIKYVENLHLKVEDTMIFITVWFIAF